MTSERRGASIENVTAAMELTRAEYEAESLYRLTRRGALGRSEFVRRMRALEDASPLAACYVFWLLLRRQPGSEEKEHHWGVLCGKLRVALEGGPARPARSRSSPALK